MNNTPSLKKIVTTDYISFICTFTPILLLVITVIMALTNPGLWAMICFPGILILGMWFWLFTRINLIRTVFAEGNPTSGTLTGKFTYRGHTHLYFTYEYQGQSYKYGNRVMLTAARGFEQGATVALMVDPGNPKRAFIRDLYL